MRCDNILASEGFIVLGNSCGIYPIPDGNRKSSLIFYPPYSSEIRLLLFFIEKQQLADQLAFTTTGDGWMDGFIVSLPIILVING